MEIDDVNGLLYAAISWSAAAGMLPKPELERLEARLKVLAAQHRDADSIALRCFATACQAYFSQYEEDLP